jgi:hypothetical protein
MIGIPRQRVPFRLYIYSLLDKHNIPIPEGIFNTKEELWGYFIEEMVRIGGIGTILDALSDTGGYLVSELTAELIGNTLTIIKTHTNIETGNSIDYPLTITAGQNVVFSGATPGGITISVPSIGTTTKFSSTESGFGLIGDSLTLAISATTPFVAGDVLGVGSIVYLDNNFTVEVQSIDISTDSFVGIIVSIPQPINEIDGGVLPNAKTTIQLKRAEYNYWITSSGSNYILANGEIAVSFNTPIGGGLKTMFKIGDGITSWAQLPFKGYERYNDLPDKPEINNAMLESSDNGTNIAIVDGGGSW